MNKQTNNNYKFLLLNKRDADLKNRLDQINDILTVNKPHFMILNELQKHVNDTTSKYQFPGYRLECDSLDIQDGWSRTAILIKDNIKYKRRLDLEGRGTSTVWIQVGLAGKKHYLVQALYRQYMRQGKPATKSYTQQQMRWEQIIERWSTANNEQREVITLGDTNLDSLKWDTPIELMSTFDKQRNTLYKKLKEEILVGNTQKINFEYTRSDIQPGGRTSCLDHCFTNFPSKVNSHQTHHSTFSDHSMVELNIAAKNIKTTRKSIQIISMKNYSQTEFIDNIKKS